MQHTSSEARRSADSVTDAIERVRAEGAESSDSAILVGNRAGVVEWANLAWSRITGFPLRETVHKPISHFLDVSGIELELVDFVGQRFVEGHSSTIEFPFETFEGNTIRVHLEVDPIRNHSGELEAFVATASIVTGQRRAEDALSRAETATSWKREGDRNSGTPVAATKRRAGSISISENVSRACESELASAAGMQRIHFDLALADELPQARIDADGLARLVRGLLRAARHAIGDEWGCITVMSGTTRAGRGHVSRAHAVVARPMELATGPHLYVEIHDTGSPLSSFALDRVRHGGTAGCHGGTAGCQGGTVGCQGLPPDRRGHTADGQGDSPGSPREFELAESLTRAGALGSTLHLDSTPGCGNQALLLIPIVP